MMKRASLGRSAAAGPPPPPFRSPSPPHSPTADPCSRGLLPSDARATISSTPYRHLSGNKGRRSLPQGPSPTSSFSLFARGIAARDLRSAASFDLPLTSSRSSSALSFSPPLSTNQQVKRVRCESSGVLVPKDKAVKRFIVRNIVDASAVRDLQVRKRGKKIGAEQREREERGSDAHLKVSKKNSKLHRTPRSSTATCSRRSTARSTTASPRPSTPRSSACARGRTARSASSAGPVSAVAATGTASPRRKRF